jgi:hypothetical protein
MKEDIVDRWNVIWEKIRRPARFPDGSKSGGYKSEDRTVAALLLIAEVLRGEKE